MAPTARLLMVALVSSGLVGCASTGATSAPAPTIQPAGQAFEGWLQGRLDDQTVQGKDDLDGDGTEDCWRATPSRGGGFRSVTLTVRPGCTGAMMTLASMVHALDLATVLPVPLAWRAHPAIFQGAIGMLYGRDVVRVPTHVPGAGIPVAEGLAPWLLGAVRRAGTESALSAGAPFTRVDPFEVTWTPGPPTLPTPQAVTLVAEDPTLHRALFGERVALQSADVAAAGGAWAVVLVHGRPHGKPTEAATCGPWTLYSTGHALAAHQRETDHHAWILASLRGAHPQKASLEQIDCQDALVFVEPTRDKDARELLVVHIDTGRIGRMPLAPDDRWWVHRPTSELQKTGAVYSMDSLHQQLSAPID